MEDRSEQDILHKDLIYGRVFANAVTESVLDSIIGIFSSYFLPYTQNPIITIFTFIFSILHF